MRRVWLFVPLCTLLIFGPAREASAQAPGGGEIAQPTDYRKRGLMFELGLGISGCTDTFCGGLDPSAALRFTVLYKVLPYFAAGLHWGFLFADPDPNRDAEDKLAWSTVFGAEARGILPVGKLEAWIGIFLGLMYWQVEGTDTNPNYDKVHSDGPGFAFGFGMGFDYYVIKQLAVGSSFWLYKGFFNRGCQDAGALEVCDDLTAAQKDAIGVAWAFTINATFFLKL